jgi:hypothetical protein
VFGGGGVGNSARYFPTAFLQVCVEMKHNFLRADGIPNNVSERFYERKAILLQKQKHEIFLLGGIFSGFCVTAEI